MKLLSLLLAVLAVTSCAANKTPAVEILRPAYLDAVKPVQYLLEGGQELANGCTASSINRTEHLWLTAAHCVAPGEMFIASQPAEVVEMNEATDLAVLKVPAYTSGGELALATSPPNWGAEVIVVGHPLGMDDVWITRGYVANPKATLEGINFMFLDVAGAPGNSGSPVLNKDGKVISVVQIGWMRGTFGPVMGGATYENLKWFERYFANPTVRP